SGVGRYPPSPPRAFKYNNPVTKYKKKTLTLAWRPNCHCSPPPHGVLRSNLKKLGEDLSRETQNMAETQVKLYYEYRKIVQSNAITRYIGRKQHLWRKLGRDHQDYLQKLPSLLKHLSDFLRDRKWFAGDKITFVDIIMYKLLDHHCMFKPTKPGEDSFTYMKPKRFMKTLVNKMAKWGNKNKLGPHLGIRGGAKPQDSPKTSQHYTGKKSAPAPDGLRPLKTAVRERERAPLSAGGLRLTDGKTISGVLFTQQALKGTAAQQQDKDG
ncbi:hypothetical protein Z043_112900, partial [Scleropages formosus]